MGLMWFPFLVLTLSSASAINTAEEYEMKRVVTDYAEMHGWFSGPNVCVKIQSMENVPEPSEARRTIDKLGCNGNSEEMTCYSAMYRNGTMSLKRKVFECCPGYVRPQSGLPGCVGRDLKMFS